MHPIDLTDVLAPPDRDLLHTLTLDALSIGRAPETRSRVRELGAAERSAWLAFAERNLVGPQVAHALLEALPEHDAGSAWEAVHGRSAARMRVLLGELDRVADRLADREIRMVALKNAGIARGIHPCPACSPMGDLDVLVQRSRFEEAHHRILDSGFRLASRGTVEPADLQIGLAHGGTEYLRRVGDEDVWLELQWRPVAGRWIRRDQEPDGDTLVARSLPIEGSRARLLAPADNMLQVSLHTAKHSYLRAPGLRLHTDVDRLAALTPPDWSEVVGAAEQLRVRTATYFSLGLAATLLGSSVPEWVLDALAPPRWKLETVCRWLRRAGLFEPDEPKFRRVGALVFHALLYDDTSGLLASILDANPEQLSLRQLPRDLRRGVARLIDLTTRYQP